MVRRVGVLTSTGAVLWALAASVAAQPSQPPATSKVPIVAVTGCMKQQGPNDWVLTNATEPQESSANATPAKDGAVPPLGKRQFKLIGITEYNLPGVKDHTVTVKALHIKAAPMDRLNLTSVLSVKDTCGGTK